MKNQVKSEIREFIREAMPELLADANEYGEAQITVACNDDGTLWNYQTGDNSFTGACYGLPHWAVASINCESYCMDDADALATDLIEQLQDLTEAYD